MRRTLCVVALALLVGACGGGGDDFVDVQFHSAPNVPGMSGYLHGPAPATVIPSTTQIVWVGDRNSNQPEYGYYAFNISAIPAGSQIVEAHFRVGQELRVGSPYANLGGMVQVDHVGLGAALDPADFTPTVYQSNLATLSTDPTIAQKSAAVTQAVQADVNAGRSRTDLGLRFPVPTNADGAYDDMGFNNLSNGGGSNLLPLLEIRYRTP